MKKRLLLSVLALLLLIVSVSSAEQSHKILAFEQTEYEVIPKKSVTLKPISQGIEGKLSYTWESGNEDIATVTKQGKVTGVSIGKTDIICTGTLKSGETYIAKCTIRVKQPIEKITAIEKTVTLPNWYYFSVWDCFTVEPYDMEDVPVEVEISNKDIIEGATNGNMRTHGIGKCKITMRATDGSGKQASMTVTVPRFTCSENPVVIDEPGGRYFWYQNAESGFSSVSTTDHFEMLPVDDEEARELWPNKPLVLNFEKLIPLKAGKGHIVFSVNGRTIKVPVTVEHSAVIDSVSYPEIDVNKVLQSKEEYDAKKISCKGTVIKAENGLVYAKQKDAYFAFYDAENDTSSENTYTVYGEIEKYINYKTETGLRFECPVIQTEKIE